MKITPKDPGFLLLLQALDIAKGTIYYHNRRIFNVAEHQIYAYLRYIYGLQNVPSNADEHEIANRLLSRDLSIRDYFNVTTRPRRTPKAPRIHTVIIQSSLQK